MELAALIVGIAAVLAIFLIGLVVILRYIGYAMRQQSEILTEGLQSLLKPLLAPNLPQPAPQPAERLTAAQEAPGASEPPAMDPDAWIDAGWTENPAASVDVTLPPAFNPRDDDVS